LARNTRALAQRWQRKAITRVAGLIGVEGKGRVAEAHADARRNDGGALAINLKIPLLHKWQHATCDP